MNYALFKCLSYYMNYYYFSSAPERWHEMLEDQKREGSPRSVGVCWEPGFTTTGLEHNGMRPERASGPHAEVRIITG